ncbi:MAG: phosphotransferase enzyme family protein [Pseudobacter sp.]|uniref:phosphotransferase enzyme family protein n=1 Tax=Pseudobacter sp. TaxID=2045420 RepID=UPI003F80EA3D
MSIFPTRYSTLSAPALGDYLQQQFGFTDVHCRYQYRNVSDTYHVSATEGTFILKIFRAMHRTEAEIRGEIALLQHLLRNGIRVGGPVTDLHGEQLLSFLAAEGTRHGVLYSFAPGGPVIEQSDTQVVQSGQFLARLHLQTEGLQLAYNRKGYTLDTMLHEPLKAVAPAFEKVPADYEWLKEAAAATEQELSKLNTAGFSAGYCHYDFMPKNWHHDDLGEITLFDFDFSGPGWLMNDIASYAVYLTLLNPGEDEIKRRLKLFTDSYQQLKPLQPDELKALPHLCFLFWTFYLKYQYENFEDHTNVYFGPRYLREWIQRLKNLVADPGKFLP